MRGQAEHGEAEHPVARRQMLDALADGHHLARHFVAEDARIAVSAGIERERLEHVAEIHARGLDLDQHLAGRADRQRERREAQAVEQAALAGFEAQRHGGIELLLARRAGRG